MKILFLSSWFPLPSDNGSKIRIYNLLIGLCAKHEVTLFTFYQQEPLAENVSCLESICVKVRTLPKKEFNPTSWRARLGFFSTRPRAVLDTFSHPMETLISQELSGSHGYDLVIHSETGFLPYFDNIHSVPLILEDLELAAPYERFIYSTSIYNRIRHGLAWWKTSRFITRALTQFAGCTVVSNKEKGIVQSLSPGYQNILVLPNCVDANRYDDYSEEKVQRLIFMGSFSHQPNYDGVLYFLNEIWPLVSAMHPDVEFWVTGNNYGYHLPEIVHQDRVHLTGYLDDIRPVLAESLCCVVPLRAGSGTRLKILEAFSIGTPVVSTTKGAEGLDVIDGEHLLLADTPESFAAAIHHILSDEIVRRRLANHGRELVRQRYDWQAVLPQFLEFIEDIVSSTKGENGQPN